MAALSRSPKVIPTNTNPLPAAAVAVPKKISQPGLGVQLLTAGSAACIADLITFPLDTVKVRLQVQGEAGSKAVMYNGVFKTVLGIARDEGPKALYNGIIPGLQRQMAFSAIRIGAYESVKQKYIQMSGVESPMGHLAVRIAAGVTTGTIAILSAQPTDVVKIRMQAELRKAGEKPRYNGVMQAYRNVYQVEGWTGLYKGTLPNICRNCIINVGETVVYDAAKDGLIASGYFVDGIPCHFSAAVTAGFCATLLASPVDVIKTRFMNSPKGRYRGAMACAIETAKNEGFLAFYKGFSAGFTRLVAWNVCLWLSYEQLKKAILKLYT
jgi:solute carrier family 25 uncoupling protein 8/9